MEPLKIHAYLTAARERLLDHIRPLSQEQYTHEFPFGLNTLAATLTHIAGCELWHMERMRRGPDWTPPPYEQWPIRDEDPPPLAELESIWRRQAEETRATLASFLPRERGGTGERGPGAWEREFSYRATRHDGREIILTVSPADIFTQLVVHEVHHRAQAMAMLRQMGVQAENLDPYYLMYKRREG
jgi:uncharacterized damage-inducible protein DinB